MEHKITTFRGIVASGAGDSIFIGRRLYIHRAMRVYLSATFLYSSGDEYSLPCRGGGNVVRGLQKYVASGIRNRYFARYIIEVKKVKRKEYGYGQDKVKTRECF